MDQTVSGAQEPLPVSNAGKGSLRTPGTTRTCNLRIRSPLLYPVELRGQDMRTRGFVERVKGIEPSWPAWKAGALPLSYTRV